MSIKERHGLADAIKISVGMSDRQSVVVTDGPGYVDLNIGGMTYPAGLTPHQARYVAACLNDSADRVERQKPAREG